MNYITLAVQCHNFQRRLCWMLSSIAERVARSGIIVDVAYMRNNGTPTTEEVIEFFSEVVDIKRTPWDDYARFQMRGHVRTRQLQECRTEWILFSDSDMVYGPQFFQQLERELRQREGAKHMITTGRLTTALDPATALVNRTVFDKPAQVPQAFKMAHAIAYLRTAGARGIGNSQIVSVKHGVHGGCYIEPNKNPDAGWGPQGQNTRSDVRFRKRMSRGGSVEPLNSWFRDNVVHLNHTRDKDAGCHVTDQR